MCTGVYIAIWTSCLSCSARQMLDIGVQGGGGGGGGQRGTKKFKAEKSGKF